MAYPTDRLILFDKDGAALGDIGPDEVYARVRVEQINDEHELRLMTSRILAVGTRILTVDATGKWREWVVYKPDERHESGDHAIGTYACMWSLQYDLMGVYAKDKAELGMGARCTASAAVTAALDGTTRWTVGTVDVGAVEAGKGCVMIGVSAWERLSLVVKYWGGEVDAEIMVGSSGVVSRRVALRVHLGSTKATRRFDWAYDLTSIDRYADDGPHYCRVVPLGRGRREYAEDDVTEFDWPLDISEETGGCVYIEDEEAAQVFRTRNPDGTYDYPTKTVHYDVDDPELLLAAAQEDLHNHTQPKVRYEATVLQFAQAGMDARGVGLGDETQCADWGFSVEHPLHVGARVVRIEVDELSPETDTKLTLGNMEDALSDALLRIVGTSTRDVATRLGRIEGGGTIVYLNDLLDSLNAEVNASGGYSYLIDGQGIVTYDRAVADPLVAAEAGKVTQIKGGALRIASTKKAAFTGIDDWNWRTLITDGHITTELVTSSQIVAGYIGSAARNFFLDLDNNVLQIGVGATIGGSTVQDLLNAANFASNYLTFTAGSGLDIGYSGTTKKVNISGSGVQIFDGAAAIMQLMGSYSRFGKAGGANLYVGEEGYLDIFDNGTLLAHMGFGYGSNASKCYYTFGTRKSWATGNQSFCVGRSNAAGDDDGGDYAIAMGYGNEATGDYSVALGSGNKANGAYSVAVGQNNTVRGDNECAFGKGLNTSNTKVVVGSYNIDHSSDAITVIYEFVVGVGTSDYNRKDGFTVDHAGNGAFLGGVDAGGAVAAYSLEATTGNLKVTSGNAWICGNCSANDYTTRSDRRLKRHVSYITPDEAADFVRSLKPAVFEWLGGDGARHAGFYAQDVREADVWGTDAVRESDTPHGGVDRPLVMDYQSLIAPLVAYAQGLEGRVADLEATVTALEKRMAELERWCAKTYTVARPAQDETKDETKRKVYE